MTKDNTLTRPVTSGLQKQAGIACLFPGIGYTCDRPLLYYTGRMMKELGYEVVPVPYTGFPKNVRGDAEKMRECFFIALDQAIELLRDIDFSAYDDIVFVGKSVGTIAALACAKQFDLTVRSILYTPVLATFDQLPANDPSGSAIVFHGTSDPWAKTSEIITACKSRNIPLHLAENANHSLETGNTETDLNILETTLKQAREFLISGNIT